VTDRNRETLLFLDGEADCDPAAEELGCLLHEEQAHDRDPRDRRGLCDDGLEALGETNGGGKDPAGVQEGLELLPSKSAVRSRAVFGGSAIFGCLVHPRVLRLTASGR
jgi:hypothetical protein